MSYYINKLVTGNFEDIVQKVTKELKNEGFGVLTEVDVDKVLKQKIDVDFPRYKILGACNPGYAHQALQNENKVGTMLPCNVIVRQASNEEIEVAAVDPIASMQAIENPTLSGIAHEVKEKLSNVISNI